MPSRTASTPAEDGAAAPIEGSDRLVGHGAWALADQGLASAATFLAHVLLARMLEVSAYGAFVVAYQSFALLMMMHSAVIGDPILVLAPGRYRAQRDEYLRTVMFGQLAIGGGAGLTCALVAAAMGWRGQGTMAASFAGLAVAAPPMLALLALRRAAYARFQPRLAALAAGVNLVLVALGLTVLEASRRLAVVPAYLVLGGAAALAVLGPWRLFGLRNPLRAPWPLLREAAGQHRGYGSWGVAAGFLAWIPGNVFYWILPLLPGPRFGLPAAATVRALVTLVMPALQANAALGSVLTPFLSARWQAPRRSRLGALAAALIGASALYGLALVAGAPVVDWLYAGRYPSDRPLLALLAVIPMFTAGAHLLRGLTLARERPDQMFWAQLAAAIVTLGGGLPLVLWLGIPGVLAAMALGPAIQAMTMWRLGRRGEAAVSGPSPG